MWLFLILLIVFVAIIITIRRFLPEKRPEFDLKVQQAIDQARDEAYRNPPPPGI